MHNMADRPPEAPPPAPPPALPPGGYGGPGPPGPWQAPGWGYPPGAGYGWPQPTGAPGSGRFRAMNVGELLDATFSLYRRNFLLIAAISAVVQLPYAVIQFVLFQVTGFSTAQSALSALSNNSRTFTSEQLHTLEGLLVNIVIVDSVLIVLSLLLVLPLAEAATTRAVSDRYLERAATVGSSYAAAIRRLGPLIVQSLILIALFVVVFGGAFAALLLFGAIAGGAGVAIGALLVIAAVVFLIAVYVRTSLAAPAIVLEGLSGWRGLTRSWKLVRGISWRIFGIRVLVALIAGIIEAVLGGLLSLAGASLDSNGRLILQEIIGTFATVFIGPITYIAVTLLYYDTRIRKEGFDIEMLAQSL